MAYSGYSTPMQQMLALNPQFIEKIRVAVAAIKARNQTISKLSQQLQAQSQQYGFSWKGNKAASVHAGNVATMLADQGLTDLNQLGYSKDGNYLMNKATGKNLKWYKQDKHPKNPLQNKGQLGWSAQGKGRTNYMVQRDANGNPILFPNWKSNAPKGVGGFVLKAAPIAAGFIPGVGPLGAAALAGGLTAAQGGKIGDILKSAGAAGLGSAAGGFVKGAAGGLGKIGAAAAGGAASGATSSAFRGQNIAQGALRGGAMAGLGQGAYEGYKELTSTPGLTTSGAEGGLKFNPRTGEYTPGQADYGLTSPSNQGEGLRFDGAPSGQGLNFDAGAFQTGLMFDQPSSSQARYGTSQGLGRTADSLARGVIGAGLNYAFAPNRNTSGALASNSQSSSTRYLGPTASAASSVQYGRAAASPATTVATQGLGGYNPGDVSTEATGNPRQNVWNEASLRLKDALGV
jgi:hypothetical protein